MKEWWKERNIREKQMMSVGTLCVLIFLIYALIWSPLASTVDTLREQIDRKRDLLSWMKEVDHKLQILEKKPTTKNPRNGSLLSLLQKAINDSPLHKNLTQIRQVESDEVTLNFQKVEFDAAVQWLIEMTEKQSLQIVQLSIVPTPTPGIVGLDLVIKDI